MSATLLFTAICLSATDAFRLMLRWGCVAICGLHICIAGVYAEEVRKEFSLFDENTSDEQSEVVSPHAATFDEWETLVERDSMLHWTDPALKPIDWFRHFGFRHSSTDGRHSGKGIPLERSSWLNRPYHVDWFLGSLLGDELIDNRVNMDNELIGGLRIGWDYDYYWGMEWKLAWSKPNIQFAEPQPLADNGSYFGSNVGLVYYPWGDSKVRPYYTLGLGMARIRFVDDQEINRNVTLLTMPFGAGVRVQQWPWLAWRLELADNLAFGDDGVETMNNVSLTAGMELRLGAKPSSYWPWRSSRSVW